LGLFDPITKWDTQLDSPDIFHEAVRKAFKLAEVQDLLQTADRPVVIAGNGAVRTHAATQLREFVTETGIPIVSKYMGKGAVSDADARSLMTLGSGADGEVATAISRAGLVVIVGYEIAEHDPADWNDGTAPLVQSTANPRGCTRRTTPTSRWSRTAAGRFGPSPSGTGPWKRPSRRGGTPTSGNKSSRTSTGTRGRRPRSPSRACSRWCARRWRPRTCSVSYKPQYMTPDGQGRVREQFAAVTDVHSRCFATWICDPFDLEVLYDRALDSLSGGELQRVGIALCLARDADLYLVDEPSAFLDVGRRVSLADEIRRFSKRTDSPVLVVDHDLFVVGRVADRVVVFDGTPGERGQANPPQSVRDGMNAFLSSLGITFRRDGRTGRPRVNKPGSQLDREQKASGEYYYES
jgi:hypothetical protein